jgi:hypothetical protein
MSLIDAAFWTKIVIRLSIIAIVFIFGGYYGYVYLTMQTRTPNQIFKADMACGLLPELNIQAIQGVDLSKINVKVEAESSALPNTPPIAYVYRVDIEGENFTTRPAAEALAGQLGFQPKQPEQTTPLYIWRDSLTSKSLKVDAATLNFDYSYELNTLPTVPNLKLPPSLSQSPEVAIRFLSTIGRYSNEFREGKVFTYPVVMNGEQVSEKQSLQEAQLVRVDFQKSTTALQYDKRILNPAFAQSNKINFIDYIKPETRIDEANLTKFTAPRVGQTPITGNVQVYIAGTGDPKKEIFRVFYRNWETEEIPCGTYPIITPSDATRLIKEGQGKVVYMVERGGNRLDGHQLPAVREISIFTVQLAYLETAVPQKFLQPIYVAEGEVIFENGVPGNVGIYIPAIEKF